MNLTEQLMEAVQRHYSILNERGDVEISPAVIASSVVKEFDPESGAPALVEWAAVLEIRQLARSVCRKRIAEDEEALSQEDLFAGDLQPRYPATRNNEEVYVLREHLTLQERRQNSERLRKEAGAKLAHADALDAETTRLIAKGYFADAA